MTTSSADRAAVAREFFAKDSPHFAEATFVPDGADPLEPVTVPGYLSREGIETDSFVGRDTVFRMAAADAELLGKEHPMTIADTDYIAKVIIPDGIYFTLIQLTRP